MFIRERTPTPIVLYGVYLVFEGLSLRAASRALKPLIDRSHVALWRWIQGPAPLEKLFRPRKVGCFLVDETMVKVHGVEAWVWVAYEPYQRRFPGVDLCWTRGASYPRSGSSAGSWNGTAATRYTGRAGWYPEACRSLRLPRRPLIPRLKSLVERAVQHLKDRTEGFDDHFPCRKPRCSLTHVQDWLQVFLLHQQPDYLRLIALTKEVISLS